MGAFNVRTGTWSLRSTKTGRVTTESFGSTGTLPVPGDWDGDGSTTLGTWGPSNATFIQQTGSTTTRVTFGNQRR